MSEPEVTGTDIDCARVMVALHELPESAIMPLAEFRACARWQERDDIESALRHPDKRWPCGCYNAGLAKVHCGQIPGCVREP